MGAHAGVFFFDGRPVERERLALVAALRLLAPDGVSVETSHGIVIAQGACDVWVGGERHHQPVRSESGCVMTWDGRLDNRDDLLRRVGLPGADLSDAALALATIERGGVEGLRALVGDWSLVVWDSRRRTLSFARDYMGVRPLYYCRDDRGVTWSSDLGELALRTGRVDDLDEAFAA